MAGANEVNISTASSFKAWKSAARLETGIVVVTGFALDGRERICDGGRLENPLTLLEMLDSQQVVGTTKSANPCNREGGVTVEESDNNSSKTQQQQQ